MKDKDFVFLVTSKKENIERQKQVVDSFYRFVPDKYDFDVVVETSGTNWNEGFLNGIKKIRDNYALRFGVFTFDDDNYLLKDSFRNAEKHMKTYKHFQFREVSNTGVPLGYRIKIVRIPYIFLILRNFLRKPSGHIVNPISSIGTNKVITKPRKVMFCSPACMFIHHSLLDMLIDNFVAKPSLVYYEPLLFGFYEMSKGVQPMLVPDAVKGGGGTTKSYLYGFYDYLASNYYFGWYLFSHPEFIRILKEKGMIDLDFGIWKFSMYLIGRFFNMV